MAVKIQHSIRTLRLKVKAEGYAWLNRAAIEANDGWNFANATSYKAARPFAGPSKWLSAYDLDKLTAGATKHFERIGCGTIQRINAEFATRRKQFAHWKCGCFAEDSVGDGWLCLPVEHAVAQVPAPKAEAGLDLGLKDTAVTGDGARLEAGHFYRSIEQKIASAQRRGHKRQAKRLHRTAARRRRDALHRFSRTIVNEYQRIVVGDVSSLKLAKTRMAKSVLDAGWGMLKTYLQYKGQQAGRCVEIVSERNTTRECSNCKALTGPSGLDMLVVRIWVCRECGVTHDRDVNSARNIRSAGRRPPSVRGNESPPSVAEPSQTYSRCKAGISALKAAA
jgi:putative transposase